MRVMALDQSSNISGVCVLDDQQVTFYCKIDLSKNKDVPDRIKHMFLEIVKLIEQYKPDLLVVEAVQQQTNAKTSMMLSQLQGGLICYAYEHNIPVVSPMPSQWRSKLDYKQGRAIKREQLKQQSFDYVKSRFGIECSEDEAEAIAIACAMSK